MLGICPKSELVLLCEEMALGSYRLPERPDLILWRGPCKRSFFFMAMRRGLGPSGMLGRSGRPVPLSCRSVDLCNFAGLLMVLRSEAGLVGIRGVVEMARGASDGVFVYMCTSGWSEGSTAAVWEGRGETYDRVSSL